VWILARMAPRGVGAASRRTGARKLTAFVFILGGLLGSACSLIEQPVSGPVALTDQGVTVTPPKQLRIARNEQKVCLHVGAIGDVDFEKGVVQVNGQPHAIAGEAVDNEGTRYPLKVGDWGGDTVCLYRAERLDPDSDFPSGRRIAALRLRSQPPLQVREIRWLAYNRH
jgi:hypothetical protein